MHIYPEIQKNPLLHLCITEPLRLGGARILKETPHGILAYDRRGDLYLLAADNYAEAEVLLSNVDMESVRFILLSSDAFEPLIARCRLHYMRCHQAALLRAAPPAPDPRLTIAAPDEAAFARILELYRMDTPEELRRQADAGELFFARDARGADVGFVGLHPEGCFGMLEVLPEQRGRGYGAALEGHILRFCIETGRIPYCQVDVNNSISLNLQRKLGLEISPETMLMAWNFKG